MIFGGMGVAHNTKNHYMNTTTQILALLIPGMTFRVECIETSLLCILIFSNTQILTTFHEMLTLL